VLDGLFTESRDFPGFWGDGTLLAIHAPRISKGGSPMDSSRHIHGQVCRCVLIASASALALIPVVSFADGAPVGQKAQQGESVLIRNVASRHAERNPTAPGLALMVSASPNPQWGNAIQGSGNGEITDQEIDDLTVDIGLGARASGKEAVHGIHSIQTSLKTLAAITQQPAMVRQLCTKRSRFARLFRPQRTPHRCRMMWLQPPMATSVCSKQMARATCRATTCRSQQQVRSNRLAVREKYTVARRQRGR
jgi:hypothetical protein